MIQKNNRGRPRCFNRDDALRAAVNLFWVKGYDGTSMRDLTQAMGINAPSLYAEFGDKHQLYLDAIRLYSSGNACAPMLAFEAESDIHQAVRAFMTTALDTATDTQNGALGCFLSSCVATSAGEVEGTQELLRDAIKEADNRLTKRFETEKANGVLSNMFPSMERARLMFDLRQGYVLRARAAITRCEMEKDLVYRVNTVLADA